MVKIILTLTRLSKFLLGHGLVFDERTPTGRRKGNWTRAHWSRSESIGFAEGADNDVLAYYVDAVRRAAEEKARLEGLVEAEARKPRWRRRVDSLRRLKGVDTATAADLVFEAGEFSRFGNARSFASWVGLTPSEHSSGESDRRGAITKAGNKHLRKALVEAAWRYLTCSARPKDLARGQDPDPGARRHAAKGVRRLVERRGAPPAVFPAVCDVKPERAGAAAERFGCRAYTDFEVMLEQEKPDVVHICTPHYLHAPLACLAMERGCHVLTEKPMAIALADARRMLDTAAATGRTLGVIFQNRYNAGSQLIRRCLDNGDLGEVRAARVLLTWDRSPEYYSQSDWKGTWDKEGGGVIIDQAIHTLDLMRWFIGRPVTGVQASLANRTHPDIPVEDTAEGRMEFEGGAYGAFYVMNHYCTDEPVRLELACTRGKAVMEGPKARVELNNGLTCLADNDPAQMFEYGDVKQYWGTSHVKQIGNFYQSLLGLAPMYVTAENAFLTQEMICALYEHGRRHFVREVR